MTTPVEHSSEMQTAKLLLSELNNLCSEDELFTISKVDNFWTTTTILLHSKSCGARFTITMCAGKPRCFEGYLFKLFRKEYSDKNGNKQHHLLSITGVNNWEELLAVLEGKAFTDELSSTFTNITSEMAEAREAYQERKQKQVVMDKAATYRKLQAIASIQEQLLQIGEGVSSQQCRIMAEEVVGEVLP